MAKTAAKKTAGEWETRALGEFQQSKSVIWRAQISKAPDGKEFAGVRKFIVKSDGSEIADRSGITLPYDGTTIAEQVDGLVELLLKLKGGVVKIKSKTPGPMATKKAKGPFVLQRSSGKLLVRYSKVEGQVKIKTTEDAEAAKTWPTAEEAEAYGEKTVFKLKAGYKVVPLSAVAVTEEGE